MRHIDEFTIHRFRGIRDLKLEGLGQINLLVGENNSGKTSVLEALSIYCDPLNLRKWNNVSSAREAVISSLSQRERLVWLFPQEDNGTDDTAKPEILLTSAGNFSIEKVSANYELFQETVTVRYPKSSKGEVIYEDREEEVEGIKRGYSAFALFLNHVLTNVSDKHTERLKKPLSREKSLVSSIVSILKPGRGNAPSINDDNWICDRTLKRVSELATLKKFLADLLELPLPEPAISMQPPS